MPSSPISRHAAAALVSLATLLPHGEVAAAPAPPSEDALNERLLQFDRARNAAVYLPEVKAALAEHRFADAKRQASEVIEGPAAFAGPQRQAFLRSLALIYRSEARAGLGEDEKAVLSDTRDAAMLGNLEAIRHLVEAWTASARQGDPSTAHVPEDIDMEAVLTAGLDLEEIAALAAAAAGFGRLSAQERELIVLRYEYRSRSSAFVGHARRFAQAEGTRELMRSRFLVGADFPPSDGLPGRDVLATIADESNLRSTMAMGLGFALPATRPEKESSLREIMEFASWVGDFSGVAATYHFVPEEPGISARHVVLDPEKLDAAIHPGDTVNVRCGGIAHTAVVLQLDRARDLITFTDPLYEFWLPANNSCISAFSLRPYKYGYQAATLKLSEVREILDSVQGMRSFVPPRMVAEPAPDDPSVREGASGSAICGPASTGAGIIGHRREDALKRDLFRFFNFEQIDARTRGVTEIQVYLVRALEFRGDVMLRLQMRGDCVIAASLFLRRSFIEGNRRPLASDLMRSFLGEVYDDKGEKALQSAVSRPGTAKAPGNEQFVGALAGVMDHVVFKTAGNTTSFGNAVTEAGSHWYRIDAQ